ncbi:hypothetical protein KCP71_00935 [Salmonella enterica subsp. enterica]|nr:hypothetical protein KCP71_00935 [Salmonella enterica subsp. enterica]
MVHLKAKKASFRGALRPWAASPAYIALTARAVRWALGFSTKITARESAGRYSTPAAAAAGVKSVWRSGMRRCGAWRWANIARCVKVGYRLLVAGW